MSTERAKVHNVVVDTHSPPSLRPGIAGIPSKEEENAACVGGLRHGITFG